MAVGSHKLVDALFRFKSNLDSGIPQAIQIAATEALTGKQDDIPRRNQKYQFRRDRLVKALEEMGLKVYKPMASFYMVARIPEGYTSAQYVAELLDKVGVAVTPGTGYGKSGEGYIRLSITQPDDRLDEGIRRLLTLRKNSRDHSAK